MSRPVHRRQFLHLAGRTTLAACVLPFLHQTGQLLAADPARPTDRHAADARVLVLVQLAGGNDGLNTVVPHADDRYYKARPRLAVPKARVLKLTDTLGLHPEMPELHRLYQEDGLAVVTNVGYPNPNRSHFKSMDVWETATPPEKVGKTGWIGRHFDRSGKGTSDDMVGLRLGEQAALALKGERPGMVTFANPALLDFRASGALARGLDRLSEVEPTGIEALDAIQRTTASTRALSRRIREAVLAARQPVAYPPYVLCQSLRLVARLIAARLPTRVYYVTLGGFDTHAAQPERHAALLQELSEALALFRQDLRACGQLDRVLLMTFSEFGRRVEENRQQGTDHGTASVLFLLGGKVKPGIHGGAPDLARLDEQGDLIYRTDFRSVYAGVLRDWLGADPKPVVGPFAPLSLIQA